MMKVYSLINVKKLVVTTPFNMMTSLIVSNTLPILVRRLEDIQLELRQTMNDLSQVDLHKRLIFLIYCYIDATDDGFSGRCPNCHWTSGIRETKEQIFKAYYRHLAYILNKLGE